jgi:hypothetical protein
VQLGEPHPVALLLILKLEDPLDPGQVDALFLGQALDLAQGQDVTQRVTPPAPRGPAGRDQAEPVVGAQCLRMQPG